MTKIKTTLTLGKVLLLTACVLFVGSCTPQQDTSMPDFKVTASIQDIMLSVIDPAANYIWESVAIIVTSDGIEERRPESDEDWESLRHEAITLVEASNLLLMEGRSVARSGFRSEFPGIELEPEEIEALINEDRETWNELVQDLYDRSLAILNAVENRQSDVIFEIGDTLDAACESCHESYWYVYPDTGAQGEE